MEDEDTWKLVLPAEKRESVMQANRGTFARKLLTLYATA